MKRLRWFLALPAMLIAMSGPSTAADIRDKADLFSADAIKKAETELKRIEAEYKVPIQIETIPTLDGLGINEVLKRHAQAEDAHGVYVLIAKKEKEIQVGESKSISMYVTKARSKSIREAILAEFKKQNFDGGLARGVDKIDSVLSEARAEAGGSLKVTPPSGRRTNQVAPAGRPAVVGNPSGGIMTTFLMIGLGLLGVFIVIRILGAIFSGGGGGYQQRPMGGGMGGPGYGGGGYGGGGGGGGFMSSLFGGIGGALAGNWLYDQFSGRHHDTGMGQTASTYDPGTGAEAPANDDFVTPDDGGANWGDGGGDTGGGGDWGGGGDGGGGGDWGGGGGGDWGGGGGGGDWGGGGGGGDGGW